MSVLTTYAADKLLDALLRNVAYVSTQTYVGLFTTNPTMPAGTGGVEVTGGSYARVRLDALLAAAAAGSINNNALISFPQASTDYPAPVTGVGIWDAATAGNLLEAGPLAANKTVTSGDTFEFTAGELVSTLG